MIGDFVSACCKMNTDLNEETVYYHASYSIVKSKDDNLENLRNRNGILRENGNEILRIIAANKLEITHQIITVQRN